MSEPLLMGLSILALLLALSARAHFMHAANRRRFKAVVRHAYDSSCDWLLIAWSTAYGACLECAYNWKLRKQLPVCRRPSRQNMLLEQFIEYVRENPAAMDTTRTRLGRLILEKGVDGPRTVKLRWRHADKGKLYAWKAFSDLPGIDAVALDSLVRYLTTPGLRERMILLSGFSPSGKTTLVQRLKELLQDELMPVVIGMPMNFNPLRLLHLCLPPDEVSGYCSSLGLSRQAQSEVKPLSAVELRRAELILPGAWLRSTAAPQSSEVSLLPVQFLNMHHLFADLHAMAPHNFDRDQFTGSFDFSLLGLYETADCFRFDGFLNTSNRGVLSVDEVFRADERVWRLLLDAHHGWVETPWGESVQRNGLIVLSTGRREHEAFLAGNRSAGAVLDECFSVDLGPLTELDQAQLLFQKFWQSTSFAPGQGRDGVQLEPEVLPYLAHVLCHAAPQVSPRALCQALAATAGRSFKPGHASTLTVQLLRDELLAAVEGVRVGRSVGERTALLQAVAAADVWLALPHPVFAAQRWLAEVRRDFRESMETQRQAA